MAAVIAALDFGELGAPGVGPRQAQGHHGGLGPGVGEADLLDRGDALDQLAGQRHLRRVGRRKGSASRRLLPDRVVE